MELIRRHKKIIFIISALALLLSIGIGLFLLIKNNKVAFSLYGREVTKSQYDDYKKYCKGVADFMKDEDLAKNCDEAAVKNLALLIGLEEEAKKRNITVSDQEIELKYQELAKDFGGEQQYLDLLKANYGWDKERALVRVKTEVLQEKLKKYVIASRDIWFAFLRWDYEGEFKKNEVLPKVFEKYQKEVYPSVEIAKNINEVEPVLEKIRAEGFPWSQKANVNAVEMTGLTSETGPQKFTGPEDWQAISKLQKVGDVTEIIESTSGYVAAYKLYNISEGKFNNWEEFTEQKIKESKKYSFDILQIEYKKIVNNLKTDLRKYYTQIGSVFGIKTALAYPIRCSGYHFGELTGRIFDYGTGWSVGGATITADDVPDAGWPYCSPNEKRYASTTSKWDSNKGDFTVGKLNDASYKGLSCFVWWKVTISKSGYYNLVWSKRSMVANGTSQNIDHALGSGETLTSTAPNLWNAVRTEATDNDGPIYIIPKPTPPANSPPDPTSLDIPDLTTPCAGCTAQAPFAGYSIDPNGNKVRNRMYYREKNWYNSNGTEYWAQTGRSYEVNSGITTNVDDSNVSWTQSLPKGNYQYYMDSWDTLGSHADEDDIEKKGFVINDPAVINTACTLTSSNQKDAYGRYKLNPTVSAQAEVWDQEAQLNFNGNETQFIYAYWDRATSQWLWTPWTSGMAPIGYFTFDRPTWYAVYYYVNRSDLGYSRMGLCGSLETAYQFSCSLSPPAGNTYELPRTITATVSNPYVGIGGNDVNFIEYYNNGGGWATPGWTGVGLNPRSFSHIIGQKGWYYYYGYVDSTALGNGFADCGWVYLKTPPLSCSVSMQNPDIPAQANVTYQNGTVHTWIWGDGTTSPGGTNYHIYATASSTPIRVRADSTDLDGIRTERLCSGEVKPRAPSSGSNTEVAP